MTQEKQEIKFMPLFHYPHTYTLLEETGQELARRMESRIQKPTNPRRGAGPHS